MLCGVTPDGGASATSFIQMGRQRQKPLADRIMINHPTSIGDPILPGIPPTAFHKVHDLTISYGPELPGAAIRVAVLM